jgi:hypothetical protein
MNRNKGLEKGSWLLKFAIARPPETSATTTRKIYFTVMLQPLVWPLTQIDMAIKNKTRQFALFYEPPGNKI